LFPCLTDRQTIKSSKDEDEEEEEAAAVAKEDYAKIPSFASFGWWALLPFSNLKRHCHCCCCFCCCSHHVQCCSVILFPLPHVIAS
jgi:hypothetical protein